MTADLVTRTDRLAAEEARLVEILTPLDRLQEEETRLNQALQLRGRAEAKARLAVYNICSQDLWKADQEDGRQRFRTKEQYFITKWASKISRTLFFAYAATLQRLTFMGLDPEEAVQISPSHNFDHSVVLAIGDQWDYKTQTLKEPDQGLPRLLGNGEPLQDGLQRIYREVAEEAKELGPGEALRSLNLALGKPIVDFVQTSAEGEPFVLRIDVEQYLDNYSQPELSQTSYYLRSDVPLPEDVQKLLKKRLWFKVEKLVDGDQVASPALAKTLQGT